MRVSSTIACPTIGWIQRMESWKSGEVLITTSDNVSPNTIGVKRNKRHMKIPTRVIIMPTTVTRSDDLNVPSICPPIHNQAEFSTVRCAVSNMRSADLGGCRSDVSHQCNNEKKSESPEEY